MRPKLALWLRDEALFRRLKGYAQRTGRSVQDVATEALRAYLGDPLSPRPNAPPAPATERARVPGRQTVQPQEALTWRGAELASRQTDGVTAVEAGCARCGHPQRKHTPACYHAGCACRRYRTMILDQFGRPFWRITPV